MARGGVDVGGVCVHRVDVGTASVGTQKSPAGPGVRDDGQHGASALGWVARCGGARTEGSGDVGADAVRWYGHAAGKKCRWRSRSAVACTRCG